MEMPGRSRAAIYKLGRLEIDLGRREVRVSGARVALGSKAFDLIEVLIQSPGALIAKDELARHIWPGMIIDDNALQVHISAIRKALGADRWLIETTSGRGYRLLGNWENDLGAPAASSIAPPTAPPPPLPSAGDNLPLAMTELIGRQVDIQQVGDLLSAHRVVTLVGPGGIGKTRLAISCASDQRSNFPDGVWFADLSPLSDISLVPSVIASSLGLEPGVGDTTAAPVARAIGGRRCLIVLDNCEHVIAAAAQTVETIVRTCGAVSILATSREPLRIEAEGVYRVLPLGLPPDGQATPADLLQHGAVQLFVARIGGSTFAGEDQAAALETVATICRHLDGIPLAIELAAASASTLGLEATVRHLDNRFQLLIGGRRTAPPRQRTLLATLDWSHELLSETESLILRRLAVFAGGFTLDAACAVVATPATNRREIADGIARLATKSLVAAEAISAPTRYFLLETVRAYALDKLAASGEIDATMRRHAAFYTQLLQEARADSVDRPVQDWRKFYRREMDNVRTALGWAFSSQGDANLAVLLSTNAIPLMFDLSLVAELHRYAEEALQLLRSGLQPDPRCELHLLTALQATRVYTEGPSTEALAGWQAVLELATAQNDRECQMRALWGLWNDNIYGGAPAAALTFATRIMNLAAGSGDPAKVLLGHRVIGISLHYCGDQPAARVHLAQVIERYVRAAHLVHIIGSRLDHATVTRATLARVLWLQGQPDEALHLSEVALADACADDHLMSILYILVEAAIPVSLALGNYAAVGQYVGTLLERATRSGYKIWQIYGRCFQEVLRVRDGGGGADLDRLLNTINELREIGFCAHLPLLLGALAIGQAHARRPDDGLVTVDEALDWSERQELRWYEPELLRIKAGVILRGSPGVADAQAETLLRRSIALAQRQGALSWELRAATSLARLLQQQGHADQAQATLAPVYGRFTEGLGTADLISARALLDGL
jgi:predicted ATPase/DNA-binding winged helix-turn-helix (wHTH) protein